MSNYFKKFLFTALVFMMPYMSSVSKAMETDDYEGSAVRARKTSFVTEDQKNFSSFVKQSVSSQIVSLEEAQDSWASYLISPIKTTMQMTSQFMEIARSNPKLAIAVGLSYMVSVSAVAAQVYLCDYKCGRGDSGAQGACWANLAACQYNCVRDIRCASACYTATCNGTFCMKVPGC